MEELKLLIEMVAKLPQLALWVVIAFWIYKVVIIGSIYGVLRLVIIKIHDVLMQRRFRKEDVVPMINGFTITGERDALIAQLHRIRGRLKTYKSDFIHDSDVEWLRLAIDDKLAKDQTP